MTSQAQNPKEADQQRRDLLQDARTALEAIVEEGLTFATEQAAERVIDRLKKALS